MKVSVSISKKAGFTLVEFLVGLGVAGLFLAMFASISVFGARSLAVLDNYVESHSQSRVASDIISCEVRNAVRLTAYATNQITLQTTNDVTRTTSQLTLRYRPAEKQLVSIVPGSAPRVLLDHCESLRFSIFQRNPISGTYDQFPTATLDTCKMIQMDWVSVRHVVGLKSSETIQSAKIVIRNAKKTTF
jgi:prepilin-type N-terminal cleavage/methylation domain-containing protein